jgi:hypothetical protein
MAAEDSYIFHALKLLSASKRRRRTAEEILSYLDLWKADRAGFRRRSPYVPDSADDLEDVLSSLEKFGVVRSSKDWDSPRVWEFAATPAQPEPRQPNGGGGSGDGGRGDGGGSGGAGAPGGEGGGGAGLSEVLGHPVLFCLSDAQQDQLLMEALGLPPDDGNTGDGRRS